MAMGLALAVPPADGVAEEEGGAVGLDESHCPGGKQVGNETVGEDDADVVGCVGCVGELVVLDVAGALDVGRVVWWLVGGGGV